MSTKKDNPIALVVVLALICAVASLALGFTYKHCSKRIDQQQKQQKEAALYKVLPDAVKFEKQEIQNADETSYEYFEGYDEAGTLIGFAFEGSASGYSSVITVMVGVDPVAHTVTGISVTSQKETPGLGANLEAIKTEGTLWSAIASIGSKKVQTEVEPYFQAQFKNKLLENLKVVKIGGTPYIQALTGATISSKAVTTAVTTAVEEFRLRAIDKTENVTDPTTLTNPPGEGGDSQ